MPRIALKLRVAQWRKLLAAANAHEVELPALGPYRAALEEALKDVTTTQERRETLKQLQRETSRELKAYVATGCEMAVRLKCLVKAAFGRKDERLTAFGIKILGRSSQPPQSEGRQNGSPGYH